MKINERSKPVRDRRRVTDHAASSSTRLFSWNIGLVGYSSMVDMQMPNDNPVAVVQAWQDAANAQNIEGLVALSDPNIEIVGPRGSGYGHQLLRDWLERAGLSLTTLRVFARGQVVVVAQHGVWRSVETGAVTGEANLASRFQVHGQRVIQFARYDSLDIALEEAGLTYADEVAPSG